MAYEQDEVELSQLRFAAMATMPHKYSNGNRRNYNNRHSNLIIIKTEDSKPPATVSVPVTISLSVTKSSSASPLSSNSSPTHVRSKDNRQKVCSFMHCTNAQLSVSFSAALIGISFEKDLKFVGLSEKIPEKKAKISQKEKDDVYETTKRKRGVVGSWKTEFPWLLVSEMSSSSRSTATDDVQSTPSEPAKLYCNPCRSVYGPLANPKRLAKDKYDKYANGPFVVGCSNLRHGALVCHQNSEGHKHAIVIQTAKASKPGDMSADRALAKLNDKNFERLGKLFRNAHAIVKNCSPMTDFTWMAKLDKVKDVDIGDTYLNAKSCNKIIVAIAESTRHPIEQLLEMPAKFSRFESDSDTDDSSDDENDNISTSRSFNDLSESSDEKVIETDAVNSVSVVKNNLSEEFPDKKDISSKSDNSSGNRDCLKSSIVKDSNRTDKNHKHSRSIHHHSVRDQSSKAQP
ncbi:hypothetical protein GQR58_006606 [Nymphon striatum]|nr:hypothetical protein GQR58_006606 [Nymphon striatum]